MPRNGHRNGHNKIAPPSLEEMMEGLEFEPAVCRPVQFRENSIGALAIVRGYRLSFAGNKRASKKTSYEESSEELNGESTEM
ncbi:hypothetical protein BVY00_00380 [bacterium G20]|nr:hypothetical protein BVY00_00380 [bacterium G20]